MSAGHGRTVPPISWDYVSLQQIRDMLHHGESVEDMYRLVDQCDEWVVAAERRLDEHDRHWAHVADSDAGTAHTAAAANAADTRARLAAALDELRGVRASLETVTATFSDVRAKVEDQYAIYQSTREPVLGWLLATDDERGESKRREATLRARELMAGYERTVNEALATWPEGDAGTWPTAPASDPTTEPTSSATTVMSTADFLLMNGRTIPLPDGATKPIRSHDGQSPPAAAPGSSTTAGMPGGAFSSGSFRPDSEVEHRNTFGFDDELFGGDNPVSPPVIGDDPDYQKGEESW